MFEKMSTYYKKYKSWEYCTDTINLNQEAQNQDTKNQATTLLNITNYSSTNMTLLTAIFLCQFWEDHIISKQHKQKISWYDLVSNHKYKYQQYSYLLNLCNNNTSILYNLLNQSSKYHKLPKYNDYIWTPNIESFNYGVDFQHLVENIWDMDDNNIWKKYNRNMCLNGGLGCGNVVASTYVVSRCFFLLMLDTIYLQKSSEMPSEQHNVEIMTQCGYIKLPPNYINYFCRWGNGVWNESAFGDVNYRGLVGNRLNGKWIYNVGYINGLFNMTDYELYPQSNNPYYPSFIENPNIDQNIIDSDFPKTIDYDAVQFPLVGHPGATYGSNSLIMYGSLKKETENFSNDDIKQSSLINISFAAATNIGGYSGLYMTEIIGDVYYKYLQDNTTKDYYSKTLECYKNIIEKPNAKSRSYTIYSLLRMDINPSHKYNLYQLILYSICLTLNYDSVTFPEKFFFSIGITKYNKKEENGQLETISYLYTIEQVSDGDATSIKLSEFEDDKPLSIKIGKLSYKISLKYEYQDTCQDKTKFLFGSGFTKFITSLNTAAMVYTKNKELIETGTTDQKLTYPINYDIVTLTRNKEPVKEKWDFNKGELLWNIMTTNTLYNYLTNNVTDFNFSKLQNISHSSIISPIDGICQIPKNLLSDKIGMKKYAEILYMDICDKIHPKALWNPLTDNTCDSLYSDKFSSIFNYDFKNITLSNFTCMCSGLKDFDGDPDEGWYLDVLNDDLDVLNDHRIGIYTIPLGPFMWASMTQYPNINNNIDNTKISKKKYRLNSFTKFKKKKH